MGEIHQARKEAREAREQQRAEIEADISTFQNTRARATANHQNYFQHNGTIYAVGTRYEAALGRGNGASEGGYPSIETPTTAPDVSMMNAEPNLADGANTPNGFQHNGATDNPTDPRDAAGESAAMIGAAGGAIGGTRFGGLGGSVLGTAVGGYLGYREGVDEYDQNARIEGLETQAYGPDDGGGRDHNNADGTNGDGWE